MEVKIKTRLIIIKNKMINFSKIFNMKNNQMKLIKHKITYNKNNQKIKMN